MHVKAKATIKECYEKNKSGDPAFRSLTNSMYTRLRQTVGEVYWKKAQDYLDHFLKQMMTTKEKRLASGGLGRQSTTTITATSEQKTTMEKKKVETDKLEAEKKKKRNAANRKRRAEQKKNKEEEKINQLIASKDKEITEKDKEIAILKESLEISKQIGAVELSDEEIAILQDAVETVDMTNDELEPASKRPRTEDTPMKSLAGILLEETGKKVVKVKQEQMETRADLEDVRDDLDIANETVTQQAVFTDAWQSKFDELAAIAQAAGVDGKIISEIRNRSITNGSS